MLRSLGIPARVAAGFTTGKYDDEDARVDGDRPRRAHLGRGLVPGLRLAAVRPDAVARRRWAARTRPPRRRSTSRRPGSLARGQAARADGLRRQAAQRLRVRPGRRTSAGIQADVPRKGGRRRRRSALTELGPQREPAPAARAHRASPRSRSSRSRRSPCAAARYLTRDPRRIAAACRRELTDFLVDQRIAVPAERDAARAVALVDRRARRRRPRASPTPSPARASARPAGAREAARQAREERKRVLRSIRRGAPAGAADARARLAALARRHALRPTAVVMAAGEGRTAPAPDASASRSRCSRSTGGP